MTLLKHVASVRVSNVDKKSYDDEISVRLCNYTDVYYGDVLSADTGDYMTATASAEQIRNFRLETGDTVLTKDSETADDIGISAYIAGSAPDFVCGYHLAVVRPDAHLIDPRFLFWTSRSTAFSRQLSVAATGVTRYGLRSDVIANVGLSTPGPDEQRRIADFLDDQVGRLDRALAHRQEQLDTLAEWSLVAVSDILAPPARSGDGHSEVPWLSFQSGPLTKLSSACALQSGVTVDASRTTGVEYPYLRVANVQNGSINLAEVKRIIVPAEVARRSVLREGDVLMTEGGDIDKLGRGAVWHAQIDPCLHQNHVFALRPDPAALLPGYLAAMTRTHHARCYFESTGSQSTNLASTNSSKVLAFRFPLPSLDIQEAKVREVHANDESAHRLSSALRAQVDLLQERKQALITAAVTGQLDVTTARAVE